MPARTPPGPSSQNSEAPAPAALRMQSSQRTGDTTWRTSAALISAGWDTARPVVFENTRKRGSAKGTPFRNFSNPARAGSISRLW